MKKTLKSFYLILGFILGASALTALAVQVSVPSATGVNKILVGLSTGNWANSDIKTVNGNSLIGSGNITITGGGSGNVATSTSETSSYIPFWTSTNGTPATLSGGVSGLAWDNTLSKLTATNLNVTGVASSTGLRASGLVNVNLNTSLNYIPLAGTAFGAFGADNGAVRMGISSYGTAGTNAYAGRHARGTMASPTAVQANDRLMSLDGYGYGSTGYSSAPSVSLRGFANQTWTDANQGAYMSFWTTPDNTVVPAERMRLTGAGYLGIGTTTPGASISTTDGILAQGNITGNNIIGSYFTATSSTASTFPSLSVGGHTVYPRWHDGTEVFNATSTPGTYGMSESNKVGNCLEPGGHAVVIDKLAGIIATSTAQNATDGVTFNINIASSFSSSSPLSLFSSPVNVNSKTAQTSFTSFSQATIPAGNCWWVNIVAASSTDTTLNVNLSGYEQ